MTYRLGRLSSWLLVPALIVSVAPALAEDARSVRSSHDLDDRLDYCQAATASAPATSQHAAWLLAAERLASDQVVQSLQLLRAARSFEQPWLYHQLYPTHVAHWLRVKGQLCRCLDSLSAASPTCADLQSEWSDASSAGGPRHGIDLERLTRGR